MTANRSGRRGAAAALAVALAVLGSVLGGCAYTVGADDLASTAPDDRMPAARPLQLGGYHWGTVHPTGVRTVYVEMFSSLEFRREIEFRLTEAISKRILLDTPYTIAGKNRADTLLYGELLAVPVTVRGRDFDSDLPRSAELVLVVNWTWKDRRTGEVLAQRRGMEQAADFIPLAFEDFFDGSDEAINDLAERIVEAMEADW